VIREVVRDEFVGLNLVGCTRVFLAALCKLKRCSRFDAPVLIRGETGTGKEMAARAIHYLSERRDHPFIPVDCGAIPDNLVENELFGHERGAYTDARQSQRGLVAQAEGGTLFLDEIDALSNKAQVALLRFLQSREFRALGSQCANVADVRVITASNADLADLVSAGQFRQDLFFRIDVLSLELPPLRQRRDDIELLARHFMDCYGKQYHQTGVSLAPDTLRCMREYNWPGNVRELENFIHRGLLMCDNGVISEELSSQDKPADAAGDSPTQADIALDISLDVSMKEAKARLIQEFERKYLRSLMAQSCGNVTRAAKIAGQERRALGKLLRKHGIDKNEFLVL
jgi:DNA-binding NtrC family response regulator